MQFNLYAFRVVLGTMCLMLSSGCASMMEGNTKGKGAKESEKKSWFQKKEYQIPQSMNVTWVHDIISVPGKPPTRGFGGRIYFYNEKSQAIPVDGELMVYGFDDTDSAQPGGALAAQGMDQADKRFRYTDEQFTTHFSQSDLGASYSIWVPWDAAPGPKKRIMLIPTFKSQDGKVLRGNAATLLLPGWTDEAKEGQVIQASAAMPLSPESSTGTGLEARPKTTTIQMPARSASRVQPLLTPEQANELIERARQGELPTVSPATSLPMDYTGTSMQPVVPQAMPSGTVANPNAVQASTIGNDLNKVDLNRSVQSGSMPLFHVPSVGLSPSLLVGAQPFPQSAVQTNGSLGPSSGQLAPSLPVGQSPGQPTRFEPSSLQAPGASSVPSNAYPLR